MKKSDNKTPSITIPIVHLQIVRDSRTSYSTTHVTNPADVSSLFQIVIGNRNTENILICAVDSRSHITLLQIIGTGAVDYCQFSVPDIWKAALISNASGVIVAHNHPSGNTSPSESDYDTTKNLIAAGKIIGIPLLDHIIVSGNSHYSFRESEPDLWN